MSRSRKREGLTIIFVPGGAGDRRAFHLSHRTSRLLAVAASVAMISGLLLVGACWMLAERASRVGELEAQVAQLQAERTRMDDLGRQVDQIEGQYERIRRLFGPESPMGPSELWLPPSAPRRSRGTGRRADEGRSPPDSWPLTERGFVTQLLLDEGQGEHPGVDIAVPTDSYIRAAGAGTVVDVGEDPVYGRYVVIDHGEGYESLYAHASTSLVRWGQRVRRNEVIGLTGSTGRSTAPHLHFEIMLNGEPIDPLTLVSQP